MHIRIRLRFVRVADAFAWLFTDQSRAALEDSVSEGSITREAADELLSQDAEASAMDGAFDGVLLFERPTLIVNSVISAEAARRARELAASERSRAESKGEQPRFSATVELLEEIAYAIRPEMTYAGAEGKGDQNYARYSDLPEQVQTALPPLLASHYVLTTDMAEVLKKKPPC